MLKFELEGKQLDLGLNIDKGKTAIKVKRFLTNDFEYMLRKAGTSRALLASPAFSPTPVAHSNVNSQEAKLMHIFEAQRSVTAIIATIKSCSSSPSKPYKQILEYRILNELKDWEVCNKVGFGATRYKELKENALCEFADRLDYYATINDVTLPDLHVY